MMVLNRHQRGADSGTKQNPQSVADAGRQGDGEAVVAAAAVAHTPRGSCADDPWRHKSHASVIAPFYSRLTFSPELEAKLCISSEQTLRWINKISAVGEAIWI